MHIERFTAWLIVKRSKTASSGTITLKPYGDIKGDLFELCQGKVEGRTSSDQVTMMKNGGGSHMDFFTLNFLIKKIQESSRSTSGPASGGRQ